MKRCNRRERPRSKIRSMLPTPASLVSTGPKVTRTAVRDRVRQLFTPALVHQVLASAKGEYRQRLLTIEVVVLAMLEFVLWQLEAFVEIVDHLRVGTMPGLPKVEVTPSAFYKRLRAISHTTFLDLLRRVTMELHKSQTHTRAWVKALAPFAKGLYALDDTTLDALMRRTPSLKKHPKGAMETLGGRLGCALDIVSGKFAEVLYDPDSKANEKTHARPLIERLGAGALYVFDLGYFAFPFLDYLSEHACYFVTRMRNRTSYEVVRELASGPLYRDNIVWLGKHRADRAEHPVRLVELLIGGTWYRYLTNVLDPRQLGARQIWALYGQRWTIEMSFAVVKRSLGLAYLRLTHQNGILIQIWCTLAVYQILQDLRLDIAMANDWNEDEVSWEMLMRRIDVYSYLGPASPLRDWLVQEGARLFLKKRGCRHRRITRLPDAVAAACDPPPPLPDFPPIPPRKPRQGDQRRSRKTERAMIMAALS